MYWNYTQQLSFRDIHNVNNKMADEVTINLRRMMGRSPSVANMPFGSSLGSMYKVYDTTINLGRTLTKNIIILVWEVTLV